MTLAPSSSDNHVVLVEEENRDSYDEEAPLLSIAECRICQEEDSVVALETPCSCNGSLKVIFINDLMFIFVFVYLI